MHVQVDIRLRVKGGGFTGQIYALRQARLLGTGILAAQKSANHGIPSITESFGGFQGVARY